MKAAEHRIPEYPWNEGKIPEGRAATPEQKQAITGRILAAWLRVPSQRFGQFLSNALHLYARGADVFHIEDEATAAACERFAEENAGPLVACTDCEATFTGAGASEAWRRHYAQRHQR